MVGTYVLFLSDWSDLKIFGTLLIVLAQIDLLEVKNGIELDQNKLVCQLQTDLYISKDKNSFLKGQYVGLIFFKESCYVKINRFIVKIKVK